ncbi:hypothetical protein [Flagellimonas sp. S3867]|uniref:hypothetical protein n=1 Tax=Flagellimonas sp. S3867 TaxID=2768063 RepID=UPI001683F31C|nr:hypothetical protein [Flagellimonas sp. S3867]
MASADLTTVFSELFKAPLEAVVEADKKYRESWIKWIEMKRKLLESQLKDQSKDVQKKAIDIILDTIPIINIDGSINVAITMRISEVRKKKTGVDFGLQLAPIHANISFTSSTESSQESVLQASTRFAISNNSTSLREYVQDHGLTIQSPADLDTLVKKLGE